MNAIEIGAWQRWAGRETQAAVAGVAGDALRDWAERIYRENELEDLRWQCASTLLYPHDVVEWAADAAVELAIIASIWPDPLDDILGRGRARRPAR